MSQSVLIAAYSGRALAQSARRAGYIPLVADAFGDLDMREAAHAFEVVPDAMRVGFRAKPLIAALDRLSARARSKPLGLVLGSGLEDKPKLWDALDKRFGILGCNAGDVRRAKDPRTFFPLLDTFSIAHPEWSITPPADGQGWISKRVGGSGGRHIRQCETREKPAPKRYFQRIVQGNRQSVSCLAGPGGASFSLTKQWCSPAPDMPLRYGGAVSASFTSGPAEAERQMLEAANTIANALNLRGLMSFDFLVSGDTAYLLEVNPRPGASLDCLDDANGHLFHAHIETCLSRPIPAASAQAPKLSQAAAVLHADRASVTLGGFEWPSWAADRGAPGTFVPLGQPLATVFAEGETAEGAETLARDRLAELANLIYRRSQFTP